MVVMGDVFAVVATLFGVCLSAWAILLVAGLLFPGKAASAKRCVEGSPWLCFGLGLALAAFLVFSVAVAANPNPGVKLFGTVLYLATLSLGIVGGSGLSQLVGERIVPMDSGVSPFRAMGRGAGLLVVGGLLPLVGWFVFAPVTLIVAMGAGLRALFTRSADVAPGAPAGPSYEMGTV
jgi:hypothetical protein